MTESYINPAAIDAERMVIGAALNGSKGMETLAESDFYDPRHQLIAGTILGMIQRGLPITTTTVAGQLDKTRGDLTRVGGILALHDLQAAAPVGPSVPYFAELVRLDAIRRWRHDCAVRLQQLTNTPAALDDLDGILAQHDADMAACPPALASGRESDLDLHQWRTIRYQHDDPDEWIIPGHLARLDRVVITGQEGVAKSTLLRQLGGCTAAGLNPWNAARVADGHRVLVVDCENSDKQIRRGIRMLGSRIERRLYDRGWDQRVWSYGRPAGINLLGRDVPWLRQRAEQVRPDLIIIGPMYKLMRGDPNKDSDVLEVLSVLDDIRVEHNAALIMEAHSPLASGSGERPVRPFGSSVQLRWPEIGFGIRPDDRPEFAQDRLLSDQRYRRTSYMECVSWRGQREGRDWPPHIRYGDPDQLPWVPTGTFHPSVDVTYEEQPVLAVSE